ncbi:MAG: hypothetical protein R3200_10915 [Xanthomonadales bacterium]|nr:hypothetical protein [Xanthomonadales bacterium]
MRRDQLPDVPKRPLAQRLGAILWPSFLLSGVATLLAAGLVDLDTLTWGDPGDEPVSGTALFSILFFLLWALSAGSSWITWLLLRSADKLNAEQADHDVPPQ